MPRNRSRPASGGPSHTNAAAIRQEEAAVASVSAPSPQRITDLLSKLIRDVPDYPQPGVVFKDITPLLADGAAFVAAQAASYHGPVLKLSEDGFVTMFLGGRRVWEM